MNLSLPRRADWRGSINLSASRTTRDADNLDQRYSGSFSSWRARANLGGPVPRVDGLTTQARLNYRAAGRNVQGRDGAQASVDMSFRYRFLENRASMNLSIRDPFGLQRTEREIRDLTVWEVSRNSNRARSAQISLSYALGGGGPRGGGGPPRGTAGR